MFEVEHHHFQQMSIPQNKEELQKAIIDNYEKLVKELTAVPIHLVHLKNLEGHSKNSTMSVHNLVSYLIGWGQLVIKWHTLKNQNIAVDFPETGFKWNELGKLAQKFYSDYESIDYDQLLTKLETTVTEILQIVEIKTNEALYQYPWCNDFTMGRMIQLNTASPFNNAKNRLRKWKKSQSLK